MRSTKRFAMLTFVSTVFVVGANTTALADDGRNGWRPFSSDAPNLLTLSPPKTAGNGLDAAALTIMRAEAPILETATKIELLVSERGFDGFTGTAVESGRLVLYWNGLVPEAVVHLVKQTSAQVSVEIRTAAYSASVLRAEARRLSLEPGVNGAGVLADFSGLWIGVDDVDAQKRARQIASPVKVVPEIRRAPIFTWRWNDSPPFWGGAVVEHESGCPLFCRQKYCTTGFAARRLSNGQDAMTLSRHCGQNEEWHTPVGHRFVGNTADGVAANDSNYMTGQPYAPRSYVGQWDSGSSVNINGLVTPVIGAHVCYSGGFSGAVCNSFVTTVGAYAGGIGPGFWTEHRNRLAAAGQGDSGGPILAGSTGSGLNGMGVSTLIDRSGETTCQGITDGGRICSWRAFGTNLWNDLTANDLQLLTVP